MLLNRRVALKPLRGSIPLAATVVLYTNILRKLELRIICDRQA